MWEDKYFRGMIFTKAFAFLGYSFFSGYRALVKCKLRTNQHFSNFNANIPLNTVAFNQNNGTKDIKYRVN